MSGTIKRTHFLKLKSEFNPQGLAGFPGIVREIEPTPKRVTSRVARIPFNWINKRIYDENVLPGRIAQQDMRLFDIFAHRAARKPIGYSLVIRPDEALRQRYCHEADNPAEIENIALFKPGTGQGRRYLHRVLNELFQDGHDAVYLNTSESNFPTLPNFYRRAGMTDLGQDEVADFNNRVRERKPLVA